MSSRHVLRSLGLALALAAIDPASLATAQRCVDPADSADQAGQDRWCGAELRSGFGGTAGFGTSCLGLNDDGSSNGIDITSVFPMGLRFFTATPHTRVFVNTNGNITFSSAEPTYTPAAFPVAGRPMIAPFWADVDIREPQGSGCNGPADGAAVMGPACHDPSSNGIWWHFTPRTATDPARAYFTWHEVGYYQCSTDRRQSFQLILEEVEVCGARAGDFNVEFRFNRCEWDTGDASGGSGGFAVQDLRTCSNDMQCRARGLPFPAPPGVCRGGRCVGIAGQSGFDAGDMTNFYEIMGSRDTRVINQRLCQESNVGEPGVWRFQLRQGTVQCPEAGMECSTGMPGICAEGRTSCACSGTECTTSCQPQVEPRAERCNQLDDDCDGMVDDEGEGALCPAGQECMDGACVGTCFEGGCPSGFTCTDRGCVEDACATVTCPAGERCRGGECVDACGGVTCPEPTVCVGGACVDPCAGITCDECTACDAGACVTRCDLGGSCGAGEECDTSTGACVDAGCAGTACTGGQICRAGACVDPCVGAVCPEGEMCSGGACVPEVVAMPDAGMPVDAGTPGEVDSGTPPMDFDAGTPGEPDAGRRRAPPSTGDGCCTVAAGAERGRQGGALLAALALGLAMAVRLRRRR